MDNKYNNLFYWENLLIKRKNIWSGNFKDIPISPRSLFINTTIIDYEKIFLIIIGLYIQMQNLFWGSYNIYLYLQFSFVM